MNRIYYGKCTIWCLFFLTFSNFSLLLWPVTRHWRCFVTCKNSSQFSKSSRVIWTSVSNKISKLIFAVKNHYNFSLQILVHSLLRLLWIFCFRLLRVVSVTFFVCSFLHNNQFFYITSYCLSPVNWILGYI